MVLIADWLQLEGGGGSEGEEREVGREREPTQLKGEREKLLLCSSNNNNQ